MNKTVIMMIANNVIFAITCLVSLLAAYKLKSNRLFYVAITIAVAVLCVLTMFITHN